MSQHDRDRYARDKDRIQARHKAYRERNKEAFLAQLKQRYAKDLGLQTKTIWRNMISRCHDPRHDAFKYYGAQGIQVCERWRASFAAFVEDMGIRPSGLTLDRIQNDGNYEKRNCRWATRSEQMKNKRLAIHQIPACTCGDCKRCRNRAATRRYRDRKAAA